jgi:hypothetical protein
MNNITIDWDWVKSELYRMERIKPSKEAAAQAVLASADKCLLAAMDLAQPRHATAVINISGVSGSAIILSDGTEFSSHSLARHMKGAEEIVILLVTIGDAIEKMASQAMTQGDPLEGYLFDRIGSIAVESLAENMERSLRESVSKDEKSLSIRYSPGYCNWPIEEQYKLEKLLDFSKAGIKLTDKCLMVPMKSISAICGIGPKSVFHKKGTPCSMCELKSCDYRRT